MRPYRPALLLFLLTLATSRPLGALELWPRDADLADSLGVDIAELEDRLGVDRALETQWLARLQRACDTYGEEGEDCNLQAPTLGEQAAWAEAGGALMQNEYAMRLLDDNRGRPSDDALAALARAAAQDEPHAEVTLGWLCLHGIGLPRNLRLAALWNRKGARQGHPEGANNLGFQLENGLGVPRDLRRARDWYRYAAIRGSDEALARLQALEASGAIDDENAEDDQRRAREARPRRAGPPPAL